MLETAEKILKDVFHDLAVNCRSPWTDSSAMFQDEGFILDDLKEINSTYSNMLKRLKRVAAALRIVEIVLFPIAVLFWQKIILLLINMYSK